MVKVVAERQGMALVIRSDGTYGRRRMIYNIPEVDITEKVIKEIFRRAGKVYTRRGPVAAWGRVLGVDTRRAEGRPRAARTPGQDLRLAARHDTLRVGEKTSRRSLVQTCNTREALVVVGLPVRDDGTEGESCARARRIATPGSGRGLACEPWDESWSSREAGAGAGGGGCARKGGAGEAGQRRRSRFPAGLPRVHCPGRQGPRSRGLSRAMLPPSTTPMMAQYRRIKERYPDAVLLFRLGDFYEMFDRDARRVRAAARPDPDAAERAAHVRRAAPRRARATSRACSPRGARWRSASRPRCPARGW